MPFYIDEFDRYELPNMRIIVGLIQIIAGIFLVLRNQKTCFFSALSLALLMMGAIIVRVLINDHFYLTLPAVFYFLLNSYLTYITYINLKS